jgi:transcriptional regulator GlxA family with amidase domain
MYLNIEEKYLEQRGKTLDSTQVRLQMVMQYIHENYKEKISLEDISNHGMVSKSTALNLFRRYLNDTPIHYLLRYRLQEAAKLLVTTEKKIAVISECSGFDNVEYFCKMFKKYYKITPTKYWRKKAGE